MAGYLASVTLSREKALAGQHTHLRSENEGLHEPAHRLHVIGELPHHLHHHTVVEGGVGIHMTDLCVAILEV